MYIFKKSIKLNEGFALRLPTGGTPPVPPIITRRLAAGTTLYGVAPAEL